MSHGYYIDFLTLGLERKELNPTFCFFARPRERGRTLNVICFRAFRYFDLGGRSCESRNVQIAIDLLFQLLFGRLSSLADQRSCLFVPSPFSGDL